MSAITSCRQLRSVSLLLLTIPPLLWKEIGQHLRWTYHIARTLSLVRMGNRLNVSTNMRFAWLVSFMTGTRLIMMFGIRPLMGGVDGVKVHPKFL